MIKTFPQYILFLLFLCFLSCDRSCSCEVPSKQVLLVYLASDNESADFDGLQKKLEDLKKTKSFDPNYRLLVCSSLDSLDGSSILFEINPDGTSTQHMGLGRVNRASKEHLAKVLKYVVNEFEAERYALFFISQTKGWLSLSEGVKSPEPNAKSQSPLRTAIPNQKNRFSIIEFAELLPVEFEYIIFESGYMAGIESAYQLRNKCKYIIATPSEMLAPGFTGIYPELINTLSVPKPDLKGFVDSYHDFSIKNSSHTVPLSVISTQYLDSLASVVRSVDSLIMLQSDDINYITAFDVGVNSPPLFFDFMHYYSLALPSDKSQEIEEALRRCVMHTRHTRKYKLVGSPESFEFDDFSGLTTYIKQNVLLDSLYQSLDWYKDTH